MYLSTGYSDFKSIAYGEKEEKTKRGDRNGKQNNRNSLEDSLMNRRVVVSVLVAVFVLVGLASPAIAQASTDAVLVMHFDEGSGTIVKDESGYGNDGTIYGATWTSGISGKALSFDGRDDYVEIPYTSTLNPTHAITIEGWFKSTPGDYRTIASTGYAWNVGNGWLVRLTRDTEPIMLHFRLRTTKGIQTVGTYKNVENNEWTHFAAIYDGSQMKLYVNSVLDDSAPQTGNILDDNNPLRIGRLINQREYFSGIVDEIAIYPRALTSEEIKAHYLAKRASYPTTALSLTKTASPYSIKQEQKTTVKITIENTGTTMIKDIEVVDTLPADFDFVSGDTSSKYRILKPGESRTFQYTLRSGDTGKFNLGQATATFADEEGNYHTVKSNSPMVEVMSPLEKPEIPTGEEGEKKGIPGFELAFAIAGLLAVAYLVRRRE